MLEPAMFIGLGAVAVWTHLRFPTARLLGGTPRGGHPASSEPEALDEAEPEVHEKTGPHHQHADDESSQK